MFIKKMAIYYSHYLSWLYTSLPAKINCLSIWAKNVILTNYSHSIVKTRCLFCPLGIRKMSGSDYNTFETIQKEEFDWNAGMTLTVSLSHFAVFVLHRFVCSWHCRCVTCFFRIFTSVITEQTQSNDTLVNIMVFWEYNHPTC